MIWKSKEEQNPSRCVVKNLRSQAWWPGHPVSFQWVRNGVAGFYTGICRLDIGPLLKLTGLNIFRTSYISLSLTLWKYCLSQIVFAYIKYKRLAKETCSQNEVQRDDGREWSLSGRALWECFVCIWCYPVFQRFWDFDESYVTLSTENAHSHTLTQYFIWFQAVGDATRQWKNSCVLDKRRRLRVYTAPSDHRQREETPRPHAPWHLYTASPQTHIVCGNCRLCGFRFTFIVASINNPSACE